MSFEDKEQSAFLGTPERLFLFTVGPLVYGYVQSAMPAAYNNITYDPVAQIDMDDIAQALSEDSPTVEIRIDASAPLVQQFIPYMPNTMMQVRVYRHHVEDADNEYKTELIADIVSASIDEETGVAILSARMLASAFDRKVPWPAYQKPCNYVVYGPGCQVNRDDFKTETLLVGIDGARISSPDFAAVAALHNDPRWFVLGYVVRLIDGQTRWIIGQEGEVLRLRSPFVGAQGGDAVVAFAGCDLLKTTCDEKFNNLPRHMGFPWGPIKNPFTDNLYGTGSAAGTPVNPRGGFSNNSNGTP